MSDTTTTEFDIGTEVFCSDGACGEIVRVVIDPIARSLTHVVVEPKHRRGTGHLVPIDLVEVATAEVRLRCTSSEFDALEDAKETQFLSGASGPFPYEQDQMFSHPYYGLGMSMGALGDSPQALTYDRIPLGEVEVRRGEHVHATNGPIGRVQGLVIDTNDHHVTHVLLDEGHLWGQRRVAVPIGAVTSVSDGVQLKLTKDQVRDLPPVDLMSEEPDAVVVIIHLPQMGQPHFQHVEHVTTHTCDLGTKEPGTLWIIYNRGPSGIEVFAPSGEVATLVQPLKGDLIQPSDHDGPLRARAVE